MGGSIWGQPLWGDGTFASSSSGGGTTGGGGGGSSTITPVQSAGSITGISAGPSVAGRSVAIAFTGDVTAGNTIVVAGFVGPGVGAGAGASSPSVTDTLGNVYTQVIAHDVGNESGAAIAFFYAPILVSGPNTVTLDFNSPLFNFGITFTVFATIMVTEYSGLGAFTVQDAQFQSIYGSAGNDPSVLTITDSHSSSIPVTIEGPGAAGIGTVNTAALVVDLLSDGVDYLIAAAFANRADLLLPVTDPDGYETFTVQQTTSDAPDGYFGYFWDSGTASGGTGTGSGSGGGGIVGTLGLSIVLNPSHGFAGATYTVAVLGTDTHFAAGITAVTISGSGASISSVTVTDSTHLAFRLTLAADATIGARTVTVTTGSEAPTATFVVLSAGVKRGDIGWSQIRIGLDGTLGAGAFGQAADGTFTEGHVPRYLPDGTLTDSGIVAPGAGSGGGFPIFQTNGTLNGSQTLLNLIPGVGLQITDVGGNVTISALTPVLDGATELPLIDSATGEWIYPG